MMAFARFGVSFGFACIIRATVPATTGAAMLVPVRLRYGRAVKLSNPPSRYADLVVYSVLPGADRDAIPTPVASTSGFARKSVAVGPRELKSAYLSSVRVS